MIKLAEIVKIVQKWKKMCINLKKMGKNGENGQHFENFLQKWVKIRKNEKLLFKLKKPFLVIFRKTINFIKLQNTTVFL